MKTFQSILIRLRNVLAGISFIAMVALTCWQVFTRYILDDPSSWSEELVSYMFAWMSLLGASSVTAGRGHMKLSMLAARAGRAARMACSISSCPYAARSIRCLRQSISLRLSRIRERRGHKWRFLFCS